MARRKAQKRFAKSSKKSLNRAINTDGHGRISHFDYKKPPTRGRYREVWVDGQLSHFE